jgi:hypothetical protein
MEQMEHDVARLVTETAVIDTTAREQGMNRLGKSLGALAMLGLLMPALAQEAEELTRYEPFGGVGYEVGAYEPLEGYEEGVTDEAVGGNLSVQLTAPGDQAIDLVLVGPDGYREVNEVNAEEALEAEGLTPGVYALMATDDGLQPAVTTVEVALGRTAPVTLDLNQMIEYEVGEVGYGAEAYEAYEPYGAYEVGYEPLEAGVADVGSLIVRTVLSGAAGEEVGGEAVVDAAISVVGPNDYREEFSTESALEGLESGTYGVAATAEGYRMSQGVTEVRLGEVATVTLTLEPIGATAAGEGEAVAAGGAGLFGTFDADASGDITEEEFSTGFYNTIDADSNGIVTAEEYAPYESQFGLGYDELDADANGELTEEEFTASDNTGLYNEFDADTSGNVTEEEFGTGFYGVADADGDGVITTEEYAPYESGFGYGYEELDADANGEVTEEEFMGVF